MNEDAVQPDVDERSGFKTSPSQRKAARERKRQQRQRELRAAVAEENAITAESIWSHNLGSLTPDEREELDRKQLDNAQFLLWMTECIQDIRHGYRPRGDDGSSSITKDTMHWPDVLYADVRAFIDRVGLDDGWLTEKLVTACNRQFVKIGERSKRFLLESNPECAKFGKDVRLPRGFYEHFLNVVVGFFLDNRNWDQLTWELCDQAITELERLLVHADLQPVSCLQEEIPALRDSQLVTTDIGRRIYAYRHGHPSSTFKLTKTDVSGG